MGNPTKPKNGTILTRTAKWLPSYIARIAGNNTTLLRLFAWVLKNPSKGGMCWSTFVLRTATPQRLWFAMMVSGTQPTQNMKRFGEND